MGEDFEYKEVDQEGWHTLDTVAQAERFNEWMYDVIRPYCHGRILEIGSGIGNISQFFIRDKASIDLSDIRDNYCDKLRTKYSDTQVVNIDLTHPSFSKEYADLIGAYDAVFALNVIEHIEQDALAVANMKLLLRRGGRSIVLVPAFQFLYNSFDRELHHYRRYSKKNLVRLMSKQYSIENSFYFNPAGILGWYINGKLFRKKVIPKGQMKLFDQFVPIFKIINSATRPFMGLSVVCVGKSD